MSRQRALQLMLAIAWLQVTFMARATPTITKPGCDDACGNIKIPYPFGIGASCANNSWFEIFCNGSNSPPKPFLRRLKLEVMDIGPRDVLVATQALRICAGRAVGSAGPVRSIDLGGSPYRFSIDRNVLFARLVTGCAGSVVITNQTNQVMAGCSSICGRINSTASDTCFGMGCCQSSILNPRFWVGNFFQIGFNNEAAIKNHTCIEAGLVQMLQDQNSPTLDPRVLLDPSPGEFPTMLSYQFEGNPYCKSFHEGNGYLPNACQAVTECKKCKWKGNCEKVYNGIEGVGGTWLSSYRCEGNRLERIAPISGSMLGIGSMLSALGCYWLYRCMKRRKEIRKRAKYFKRNGGFLLQKQISQEGIAAKTRIYTTTELEKATDKFNKNRILGQGGQGTVYKGMLPDGGVIAVKKSNQIVTDQLEQFINEVVILSKINHRNVVKLLGCCLETEVPLLVYEYISNGTLAQHIQNPAQDFHISWKMRLQIAIETAGALSYLHSSSAAPIYHRDIKSSNILLDSKYRAKVSDFGTSRTITIEQTHLTTGIYGTFGYLDPEYFQTNQFTEKSDVYSFGVVLVELLTSKKPVLDMGPNEWRSLATEFLLKMGSKKLFDIIDNMVLQEAKEEDILVLANLTKRCLNLHGKLRPTMKEIAMTLQSVQSGQMHISADHLNLATA
ncbi:hypothetical protein Drorol1_Dr00024915 [Drosera rotundifolia]